MAAPQYYSSREGGSWNSSSEVGQAKNAPPGPRIGSMVFNTCQFRFTIATIERYSTFSIDELDITSMSSSFTDALWSAANLVQGPFAHTNHAWLPNNTTESPATVPPVPSSEAPNSAAELFTDYPVCPEEHYRGPSQQPALQNTAPRTSSRKYGLDVHSTFHLPPQGTGSLPGASSRGSNFPPRVIAPIPHRATQAIIPYETLLRPAMPVSCINPLDTMLSTQQHASGASNLTNVTGDHGFMAINEPYSAPGTPPASDFSHRKTNQSFSVRLWAPQPSCRSHRKPSDCRESR